MASINFSSYFPGLVDLLVKGFGVALTALAISWLLRRASAAHRHLVWLGAAVVWVALPFSILFRDATVASTASKAAKGPIVMVRIPALEVDAPAPLSTSSQLPEKAGASLWRWLGDQGWRGAVVGVWSAGVLLLFAGRVLTMARLRVLSEQARPLAKDHALWQAADRLARESGLRRRIDWRVAESVPVAMTWGWLRPVVLLPRASLAWPLGRQELVLRHEIAHVERADSSVRVLAGVACALHWPNPLAWLAARRLRLEQELACDDAVLRSGASARLYAEELVSAARAWAGGTTCDGAVAMAEPSSLERRILGILNSVRRGGAGHRALLGAGLAAGLLLAGCSLVGVDGRPRAAEVTDAKVQGATAGEAGSAASVTATLVERRQVEIKARFVEVKGERAKDFDAAVFFADASSPGDAANASLLGHLPTEEAARRIRDVASRFGADVLSAPTVTVLDGNKAMISIAQELRYPGSFDAPPDEQTQFETRNVGVESSVQPNILSDGRVALEVETMVREFERYLSSPPPADSIRVPLFAERADLGKVILGPGEVAVLRGSERKKVMPENAPEWARKMLASDMGKDAGKTHSILIFIEAKVLATRHPR